MSFADEVYQIVSKIPRGRVSTYRLVAQKVGTRAYRAVGQALRRNLYAPEIPCHRVVRSDGSIGGFNGQVKGEEITRKIKLLKMEGVEVIDGKVVDFEKKNETG